MPISDTSLIRSLSSDEQRVLARIVDAPDGVRCFAPPAAPLTEADVAPEDVGLMRELGLFEPSGPVDRSGLDESDEKTARDLATLGLVKTERDWVLWWHPTSRGRFERLRLAAGEPPTTVLAVSAERRPNE